MYTGHDMPRASKKGIRKNIETELKDHFSYLISSLNSSKEIENFFQDFLTKEEKVMLAKRLMLHLMIENNYTESKIKAVLGISRETVRTHKNIWERGGETYKKIIGKIAKREKTKEFWEKVGKILEPFELALSSRNDMKARAKLLSGDWMDD